MKSLIGYFSVLILVSSCSAQWHLKQAVRKDPFLATQKVEKVDTLIVTLEKRLQDTLEVYKDTIVYRDRVKVELKWKDRLVYVDATCPSDTIKVTKYITQTQIKRSSWVGLLEKISMIVILMLCLYVLVSRLLNLTK